MTSTELSFPGRPPLPARVLRTLSRERWPFLITLVVLMGLASIAIRRLPTIYESTATLLIEYPKAEENLTSIDNSGIGRLDTVGDVNPINNQVALLSSKPTYQKALDRLKLSPSEAPYGGLSVKAKGGTDLIAVSYRSEAPQLAASVVQAVVDIYIQENRLANRAKGSTAQVFLKQRLPQLQNQLTKAREQLQQFQEQHRFLGTEVETNTLTGTQNNLAQQVDAAQAELAATDEKIARLRSQLPSDLTTSVNSAGVSQDDGYQILQKQLLDTKAQIAQLQSRYTPSHPVLHEALERQNKLEAVLQERSQGLLGTQSSGFNSPIDPVRQRLAEQWFGIAADRAAQAARLNELSQQLNQVQARAEQLPQLIKRQTQLGLAVETAQSNYLAFQKKYTASEIAEQQGISNVRTVDSASPETAYPVAPNSKLLLALAFVISTGISFGVIWLRSHGDDDIDGTYVLREVLPLPILATIPWSENGRLAPQEQIADSPLASSYRLLQAHIHMLPKKTQVVAVCSWAAGEGRSSVAANLALTEAQAGQRVLLIDAGRTQTHSQTWQPQPDQGSGDPEIQPWHANLRPVLPNFDILSYTSTPATFLYKKWLALLERVRERYDLVILDCPPTEKGPDATLLAAMSDGVLWVICPERLGRHGAEAAAESLQTWTTRLLGQVVVGVEGNLTPAISELEQPELVRPEGEWRPKLLQ